MIEVGVDIVEIERVAAVIQRHGDRFRRRIYSDREWAESGGRVASLAARFAAKEAVVKALGSRRVSLREIQVLRSEDGKPSIALEGRARLVADRLGVQSIAVSLSHSRRYAVAVAALQRKGDEE